MTLREQAIKAMGLAQINPPSSHAGTTDDPHNPMEAALDGLLQWLRDNADTIIPPVTFSAYTGLAQFRTTIANSGQPSPVIRLCDLLGGET